MPKGGTARGGSKPGNDRGGGYDGSHPGNRGTSRTSGMTSREEREFGNNPLIRPGDPGSKGPKKKKPGVKTVQTHFVEGHAAKLGSVGAGSSQVAIDAQQAKWDAEFAERLKIIPVIAPEDSTNLEPEKERARRRRRGSQGNQAANTTLATPTVTLG